MTSGPNYMWMTTRGGCEPTHRMKHVYLGSHRSVAHNAQSHNEVIPTHSTMHNIKPAVGERPNTQSTHSINCIKPNCINGRQQSKLHRIIEPHQSNCFNDSLMAARHHFSFLVLRHFVFPIISSQRFRLVDRVLQTESWARCRCVVNGGQPVALPRCESLANDKTQRCKHAKKLISNTYRATRILCCQTIETQQHSLFFFLRYNGNLDFACK